MTNQLCSYSRGSEFWSIALGDKRHTLSFQLYLLLAVSVFGQGVENDCASISFLVNGDNWRMLWGPEEYTGGCHIYYHPIPSSKFGLESRIPCPSFTRRMCHLTVCLDHWTVLLLTIPVAISTSFWWASAALRPIASQLCQGQAECLNLHEMAKINAGSLSGTGHTSIRKNAVES